MQSLAAGTVTPLAATDGGRFPFWSPDSQFIAYFEQRKLNDAIDPVSKLLLAIDAGDRTLAMAQRVRHPGARCLAPDCVPLFLSDGFKDYLPAILAHFGSWVQPARCRATGPAPKPRWMPLPALLYAQVIKTMRRRRIVEVKRHVVVGTKAAVDRVLAACGWLINTSFVERLNLTLRQRVVAMRREHGEPGDDAASGISSTTRAKARTRS